MHQSFDEIKQTITKDVLWDYYKIRINANTAQHFKISQNKLKQLVELYNIVKTKDDIKATKE
jgi:hypothetical protein